MSGQKHNELAISLIFWSDWLIPVSSHVDKRAWLVSPKIRGAIEQNMFYTFLRKNEKQQWKPELDNLVLSTGLIMWIVHRKEIRKLTFRALALRRSESRNCGLCVVYIQKCGATLLVFTWQREKQQNELDEWKAFVDTVRIKSADLKNKSLFKSFTAFCASWVS